MRRMRKIVTSRKKLLTINSAHNAEEERYSMNIDTVINELMELRAKIDKLIMKLL